MSNSRFQQSPRRVLWLKVGISAALIGLLFWRIDFSATIGALVGLSSRNLLFCFTIYVVATVVATWKWQLLLRGHRFPELMKLNFVAQYYSLLLPGQIAGDTVKAYRLGKGRGDAVQIATSVFVDRVTGFLGLLVIALLGIWASKQPIRQQTLGFLVAATFVIIVGLCFPGFPWCVRWLDRLSKAGPRTSRVARELQHVAIAWNSYLRSPALLLSSIALGALYQIIAVWMNYRIGQELGLSIAVADWCWIFGIVSIVTALPFTIGGLGLREGSFVGALALVGGAPGLAVAHSFAIFSILLAGAMLGGLLELIRLRTAHHPKGKASRSVEITTSSSGIESRK